MAYNILSSSEYSEKVKAIVEWSKTSMRTIESDDELITYQIAQVSTFLGRVIRDEAEVANALEILEATKRATIRERNAMSGAKTTERGLDDTITLDETVQEMRAMYADVKSRTFVVTNLMAAISTSKRQFIERNKDRINHEIGVSK